MTLHVSLAADRGFVMPLAVAVTSIARHNPGARFAVLHDGLSSRARHRIESDSQAEIEWIGVHAAMVAALSNSAFLPPAALYRLMLPQTLNSERRTVYVDADTVCTDSLRDLAETDLLGMPLGAVRDALVPFAAGPLGTDWKSVGLPGHAPYFNSGVMAMDLVAFRDGALSERAMALLRERTLRWGDQCALNVVLAGLWEELDRRWNVQTADVDGRSLSWALWPKEVTAAVQSPAIVHFTERDKPWQAGSQHPMRDVWQEALEHTSWRGWRPPPQRLSVIRRRSSR